jgi:hypothetical protein
MAKLPRFHIAFAILAGLGIIRPLKMPPILLDFTSATLLSPPTPRNSGTVSAPPTVITGERVADMLCNVGFDLRSRFEESGGNLDRAMTERDSVVGRREFGEKHDSAKRAYEDWLKAADIWMEHSMSCNDCRD